MSTTPTPSDTEINLGYLLSTGFDLETAQLVLIYSEGPPPGDPDPVAWRSPRTFEIRVPTDLTIRGGSTP